MFCMFLFNFVNYVFLLLRMFCSVYSVSLCCSVYCLCVNVYFTAATGCQPNCMLTKYITLEILGSFPTQGMDVLTDWPIPHTRNIQMYTKKVL